MRILVLSYETPAYPGGGGHSRLHSLLEPLAGRHQLRVLSTGGAPSFGRPPGGVEVELLDPGPEPERVAEPFLSRTLRHYWRGLPWQYGSASHHRRALAAALPGHLAAFAPDVVQVEHGELAPLLESLPRSIPTVLTLHDMLTTVEYQQLRRGGPRDRANRALEVVVSARQVRHEIRQATRTVTMTEADCRLARRLSGAGEVRVVPNCVDTGYFRRQSEPDARPTVVMTGSFHYPPNQAAAEELVTRIFPEVRARVPGARLVLAGQRIPPSLVRIVEALEGGEAVDAGPDIRPHLWSAWAAVAPLRTGSGSPLKVLEALAAGVPVVTTPRVSRALEVGPDDGVLEAASTDDFVEQLCRLLAGGDERNRLSSAAEAAARRRFDRVPASALLEQVWEEARS